MSWNRSCEKTEKIHVKIPAGVDDGQQLRLAGQGERGINGGPPGDLYIVFYVEPHEFLNVMAMIFIVKCQLRLRKPRLVRILKYRRCMEK